MINNKALSALIGLILFPIFFFVFLNVDLWDPDFWWHIATGRYIVSTGSLPDTDLFSYAATMEENKNLFPERENFILKQYWLAQSLFYIIFNYAGPKGIILLRAILLILTLTVVYLWLKRSGVSFHISFISIFFLFITMSRYTGERPVLFSILFTAVMLFFLEDFRCNKGRKLFLIVPLMLLWSNIHGGFIIGNVIIVVYMLGEGLKILFKKVAYPRSEKIMFYSTASLAIAVSSVNPSGWTAFFIALSHKYDIFTGSIQEYQSPIYFFTEKLRPFDYSYAILVSMFAVVFILRNRRLDLNHILLLPGFFYIGISASRYTIFNAIAVTMIVAGELDILIDNLMRNLGQKFYKRIGYVFAIAAFCSVLLYIIGSLNYRTFNFGVAKLTTVPEGAVNFIEENRIEGNMFNDLGYGGYIAWRLYPWQKTFIDTRELNYSTLLEYAWLTGAVNSNEGVEPYVGKSPLWERLLNHYKINFTILALTDMDGSVYSLTFRLTESEKWVPVYCDPISIVFVRNTEQNRDVVKRFKLSREDIYNMIIFRSSVNATNNRINPRYLVSLGETFYRMGRLNDAATAYRYALKRMPKNQMIKERLAKIESEIREGK